MHVSSALMAALAILLLAEFGCSKPPVPEKPLSLSESLELPDHATAAQPIPTLAVLHKTFNLDKLETFPFEIPAHALQPHLHGMFESFAGKAGGASDETANISFLILNEEQNADLVSNHSSDTMFSVEASHSQAVNFDLPPSMNHPVKYFLVFRNSDSKVKIVEASFRVDF